MIDRLEIEGFKCIDKLKLDLKQFNLLAGTNSSGKSSAIQALLLLVQNLDDDYGLNGPLVSVGEFREIRNYNVKADSVTVMVSEGDEKVSLRFLKNNLLKWSVRKSRLENKLAYSNNKFQYLSSNRVGGQDIYRKNRTPYWGVGINGEFAVDYLSRGKFFPLEEDLVRDQENHTLLAQTNYWLKYIVDASIRVEDILGTDVVKASYGLVDGHYSRPQNVGSGISYLISIIVMCLGSEKDDILIIENPEIHLHPQSQSRLCEFLYFVASAGRQLIVETHSDHIFNAARVGIATKTMDGDQMTINFFRRGSDHCTRNHVIDIGEYGKIENPIPNLFDQFQADLDKMIGV
ncbi:MAG: AAA family ATPase [Lachnospiraceae bacterium]|nr:AAA family ATPase [Lachnospiraceae bacterium]